MFLLEKRLLLIDLRRIRIVRIIVYLLFNYSKKSSIGADFSSKIVNIKGYQAKFTIWDTAGQEKYKSLIPSYLRNSIVVFLVFDITGIFLY